MNDLLKELAALTPDLLEQNELLNSRRKPDWVKLYNEFEADTKLSMGQTEKGAPALVLTWTNMNIIQSDLPLTITEDEDVFPLDKSGDFSKTRANTKLGILAKSAGGGEKLGELDGKRVHYRIGLWQQKNADGSVALNEKGYPKYEMWYWEVVGVANKANGAKPALSDEEFEEKLPQVVGLDHASAMAAVGEEVISRGIRGKRIKQNEGVYTLVSA
jgi:hypothetical protein